MNSIYRRKFDISKTLIVAGTSRSGSTWLAEIISAAPGNVQIFEPLHLSHVKEARQVGFTSDSFIDPETDWPEGKEFMKRVLGGCVLTPWTTSQIPIVETKNASRLVVKFVNANMLLGWIAFNFPVKPPALIIRHPCAVVASESKRFKLLTDINFLLNHPFFDRHPHLKESCRGLKHPEEVRALVWCMRYYAPLALSAPYPFVLISYEALVRRGKEELSRLYKTWNLSMPEKTLNLLHHASKTAARDSSILLNKDPLMGWKNELTKKQVTNILNVVNLFGLNFYSEEIEPDYERLLQSFDIIALNRKD